jgi:hypothetical protein
MRFLKLLVIVMGVLIVVATTTLVVLVARRLGGTGTTAPSSAALVLDEPAGTRMVGIAAAGDRLAVQLQGGGPDRVLLIDPRTGAVVGRVGLRAP